MEHYYNDPPHSSAFILHRTSSSDSCHLLHPFQLHPITLIQRYSLFDVHYSFHCQAHTTLFIRFRTHISVGLRTMYYVPLGLSIHPSLGLCTLYIFIPFGFFIPPYIPSGLRTRIFPLGLCTHIFSWVLRTHIFPLRVYAPIFHWVLCTLISPPPWVLRTHTFLLGLCTHIYSPLGLYAPFFRRVYAPLYPHSPWVSPSHIPPGFLCTCTLAFTWVRAPFTHPYLGSGSSNPLHSFFLFTYLQF
jgi:hypothetical protein